MLKWLKKLVRKESDLSEYNRENHEHLVGLIQEIIETTRKIEIDLEKLDDENNVS